MWGIDDVVEALFSLEEPWQERFLILTSQLATRYRRNEGVPDRDKVTAWLGSDPDLRLTICRLLQAWVKPESPATTD